MLSQSLSIYSGLSLILIVFQSLLAGNPLPSTSDDIIVYPPPPDSARIQFLTSISTSTDITGKRSGFMRYILGEEESRPIFKPYGIASSTGKIFICDTQLGGLEIIDLQKKKFDYFPQVMNEYACTGCGRCISCCPAKIDIRRILKNLVLEAAKA